MPLAIFMAGGVCAFLLFFSLKPERARSIMATMMLFIALSCLPDIVAIGNGTSYIGDSIVLNPYLATCANILVILLLLYPLEVIKPGWLNQNRILKICWPFLFVVLIYYGGCLLSGEGIEALTTTSELTAKIHEFNVWGRFIILADILLYSLSIVYFLNKYSGDYGDWLDKNYSNEDGLGIRWIKRFVYCTLLLIILIIISMLTADSLMVFLSQLSFIIVACLASRRALSQHRAYSADFFSLGMNEADARTQSDIREQTLRDASPSMQHTAIKEKGFDSNMDEFSAQIKEWFETEKPYLKSGFQLSDVGDRIPVCRTYLSRIFNEGFGASFSRVVRDYRLREAENLLLSESGLPVAEIAAICGFANSQTFCRAFSSTHDGLSPGKFRRERGCVRLEVSEI